MPSLVLHLVHGELYLRKYAAQLTEQEKNAFRMGVLMPDANKITGRPDDMSHYIDPSTQKRILQLPDLTQPALLLRCFRDNAYVLGYAAHLYLDRMFFEEFFPQSVEFTDENGCPTAIQAAASHAVIRATGEKVPIGTFYSEEYLYGDYTKTNKYFIRKYGLLSVKAEDVHHPIKETNIQDFPHVLAALADFVNASDPQASLKVFQMDALEAAIERYVFGFEQWKRGTLAGTDHIIAKGGDDHGAV